MKQSLPISDEMMSAYIDGEIDGEELDRIIALESADKNLAATICEMRKLKGLVKAARQPELEYVPAYQLKVFKKKYFCFKYKYLISSGLAASVILMFFIAVSNDFGLSNIQEKYFSESTTIDESGLLAEVSTKQNINLIMHLKSEDLTRADQLLNLLETALIKSRTNKSNLYVEVIVSGPGLHMLQTASFANYRKIRTLTREYQNLTFLACGKTLQRLKDQSGKDIQIIDEAMLIASGPQWVKKRKASGWSYFMI